MQKKATKEDTASEIILAFNSNLYVYDKDEEKLESGKIRFKQSRSS